jgi:hypothetical protein
LSMDKQDEQHAYEFRTRCQAPQRHLAMQGSAARRATCSDPARAAPAFGSPPRILWVHLEIATKITKITKYKLVDAEPFVATNSHALKARSFFRLHPGGPGLAMYSHLPFMLPSCRQGQRPWTDQPRVAAMRHESSPPWVIGRQNPQALKARDNPGPAKPGAMRQGQPSVLM